MLVDLLVMGYPGAVMLRLGAGVREQGSNYMDIEVGGYVMRFKTSDLREGVEHPWRPGVVRPEFGFGTQIASAPVERYNERKFD